MRSDGSDTRERGSLAIGMGERIGSCTVVRARAMPLATLEKTSGAPDHRRPAPRSSDARALQDLGFAVRPSDEDPPDDDPPEDDPLEEDPLGDGEGERAGVELLGRSRAVPVVVPPDCV